MKLSIFILLIATRCIAQRVNTVPNYVADTLTNSFSSVGTITLASGFTLNGGYYSGTAQVALQAVGSDLLNTGTNEVVTYAGSSGGANAFIRSGVTANNGGVGTTNNLTLTFTGVTGLTNTLDHDVTALVSAGSSVQIKDSIGNNIGGALGTIATLDVCVPLRKNYRLTGTGITAVLY